MFNRRPRTHADVFAAVSPDDLPKGFPKASAFPEFDALAGKTMEALDATVKAARLRSADPEMKIRFHGDGWTAVLALTKGEG